MCGEKLLDTTHLVFCIKIKAIVMHLTGLVTRIGEIYSILYRMLVTKFDIRQVLGRPYGRWRGVINLNFSKIVCVDGHDVR